ncbi:MAG: hypothetical protein Ct9H300mP15_26470 [Gemmatimonadota bacterium]|nr:MAG: hypothetical protein Ct9H300mP15_26470 [Gemmatimonadota bacterium]
MNSDNPHFDLYRRKTWYGLRLGVPSCVLTRLHLVGVIPPMVGYHLPCSRSSYDLVSPG